jgi:hypothetical protein
MAMAGRGSWRSRPMPRPGDGPSSRRTASQVSSPNWTEAISRALGITGSHEGAFPAEPPAAGDHPRGVWGG